MLAGWDQEAASAASLRHVVMSMTFSYRFYTIIALWIFTIMIDYNVVPQR